MNYYGKILAVFYFIILVALCVTASYIPEKTILNPPTAADVIGGILAVLLLLTSFLLASSVLTDD